MTNENKQIFTDCENFINKYATLQHPAHAFVLTLWAAMTHIWPSFDCLPYLTITAFTKESGKTRTMELVSYLSANARTMSADSPGSMFRALDEESKPTMFIDEAEHLNRENHSAREFLNKGYRRGQTVPRTVGNEIIDFESYSPKCFVLIGSVYDTLRGRCIEVEMRRRTPAERATAPRYKMQEVIAEGKAMRDRLHSALDAETSVIESFYYDDTTDVSFLNERDAEIWLPLFAICRAMFPSRISELVTAAVDISTMKRSDARKATGDDYKARELAADMADAQALLLRDMISLCKGKPFIATEHLLDELRAIPTAPWRMYRGVGLNAYNLANMLKGLGLKPKPIRVKAAKSATQAIKRGYTWESLEDAGRRAGLLPPA